jgi:hypothetical protein
MRALGIFVCEKGNGVDGCTECVGYEYLYGKREMGLTAVLNVCVGNI